MGFFQGTKRFLSSLDCRSNHIHDAVVVDATLPGKTTWQQEPQYHGFRLWTRRGGRKIHSHRHHAKPHKKKRGDGTSQTAEVSHNSSFGSNMDHDETASEYSFIDASKSPLPLPHKPLKSILAGGSNLHQNDLTVDLDELDSIYTSNAVASVPPSVDGSNTLYSMNGGNSDPCHSRMSSLFSLESSILDMSMEMWMHNSVQEAEEETIDFRPPLSNDKSSNDLMEALMAVDAAKIIAANAAIEQEEVENVSLSCKDSLADFHVKPTAMQEVDVQGPRKIPSLISHETNASSFTYADIADHVDPEQDFASVIIEEQVESEHSRPNNYLTKYLMTSAPLPRRRGSMADDISDMSSVTFMTRAQLETSLEEAIPERIKLSTIANVEKASKIANKIRKLRYKYSKEYIITKEDGNSSIDVLTISSDDGTVKSKCLVLLLDPKRRTFDFIHVDHRASACTAQDLMDQIPLTNTTDFGLRFQRYCGFVHGSIDGKEALTIMKPHQHVPERFSVLFDEQESPMVAIPEGFTAAQAHALARILFAGNCSPARKAFNEMQEFLLSGLDF